MGYVFKCLFSGFAIIWCLSVQAEVSDSLRTERRKGQKVVIHQVEAGETLYSLSRRYNSQVKAIIEMNDLKNNSIDLGQLLAIPLNKKEEKQKDSTGVIMGDPEIEADPMPQEDSTVSNTHIVQPKETLYSISRMYGLSVSEIKALNNLSGNELVIGQELMVKGMKKPSDSTSEVIKELKDVKHGFKEYYVQSGDMLETIAKKHNVRPDSIVIWNKLDNTYLAIGQRLLIRGEIDSLAQMKEKKVENTGHSKRSKVQDASGFTKVFEEGVAKSIEDVIDTDKYLALHRTLKVGTMVEVRNLMNNKKIFVRIVGKLPETGLNENTLVRLTPICFKRLGVIDPQARVEISYYED